MPAVRPGVSQKWTRRTSSATVEYEQGVQAPRRSWAAATVAAAPVQAAAVQAAIAAKSFEKGVQAAGDETWRHGAVAKGVARFGPGVADAENKYAKNVQPYLDVIASTSLPARGPKGDPKNIDRVRVLAAALRARKTGKS